MLGNAARRWQVYQWYELISWAFAISSLYMYVLYILYMPHVTKGTKDVIWFRKHKKNKKHKKHKKIFKYLIREFWLNKGTTY